MHCTSMRFWYFAVQFPVQCRTGGVHPCPLCVSADRGRRRDAEGRGRPSAQRRAEVRHRHHLRGSLEGCFC